MPEQKSLNKNIIALICRMTVKDKCRRAAKPVDSRRNSADGLDSRRGIERGLFLMGRCVILVSDDQDVRGMR